MMTYLIYLRKGTITFKRVRVVPDGCQCIYILPPIRILMDLDIGRDEMMFVRGLARAIMASEGLKVEEVGFIK